MAGDDLSPDITIINQSLTAATIWPGLAAGWLAADAEDSPRALTTLLDNTAPSLHAPHQQGSGASASGN